MKRILMIAIAAATFGSVAYASQTTPAGTLMTRSEPATVIVFERDRGIYGSEIIAPTTGAPSLVASGLILTPREQAIAVDGQVTVYSFGSTPGNKTMTFSPR